MRLHGINISYEYLHWSYVWLSEGEAKESSTNNAFSTPETVPVFVNMAIKQLYCLNPQPPADALTIHAQ